MTERKRKRNTRTFNAGEGFHISRQPVVRVAADDRQRNVDGAAQLPLAYGPPLLCAIARDSHCIFAVWNIDWLSLFEKGMPVDRQIHLRVYRADGLQEKTVWRRSRCPGRIVSQHRNCMARTPLKSDPTNPPMSGIQSRSRKRL